MMLASRWFALAAWLLAMGFATPERLFAQDPVKVIPPDEYSLDLPAADKLFRIRSEADARQEIRAAATARGVEKVEFPADAKLVARVIDPASAGPVQILTVPLGRVCYNTLYYQDILTERDGESCGVVEPLRSAFLFYGKTLLLPGMLVAAPPWQYRCWDYPFVPFGAPSTAR